jgi:hypothetical protein
MNNLEKDFVPYQPSFDMKELGFDEPCFGLYAPPSKTVFLHHYGLLTAKEQVLAPLYQQAINFLYICSNKQIDIELKGGDTHEERIRKIEQGCKDLWNLQNNKSK